MKYVVTLEHPDFHLLLAVLKKTEKSGIINWDACNFVCENTKVKFDEVEDEL